MNELREKIARQVKLMQDFLKEHTAWTPEDQASYGKMTEELSALQIQKQRLEASESLASLSAQYLTPVSTVQQPAVGHEGSNISESFARYTAGDRSLPEAAKKACQQIHREALFAYIRGDMAGVRAYAESQKQVGPKEIQALLSTDNTLGGFLVFEDMRAEIIKAEAGYAVLAPLCRLENTNSNVLVFPKLKPHATDVRRTSGFAGKYQKEGYVTDGTAPTVQNQPTFQRERIPVHSWQPDAVEISPELLEDSGANIESIVAQAIAEALAFDKDDKILSGDGVMEPEGILNAGITTVNSGGATSIAIGGILGMYTELPAQYRGRATWIMASRTMGAILQLNTGTGGVYLFPPNQWNDTILGRPVRFLDYGMDTATAAGGTTFTAADNPLIFGDFSRYIIAQRAALRIQRLVERFAPNIGILPTARLGGQVVLTDAFRVMTVAA